MIYHTVSADETRALAERLAAALSGGVIAMTGDLGAGKTAFVSGLARGLGYSGGVSSPTFAICNEYIGGRVPLYHFDMYRISGWEDLYSTGYFDLLDSGALIAVEWSENIEAALPESYLAVDIRRKSDCERDIEIKPIGGFGLENFGD
mgnify:CR=1 FL=1